MPATMIFGRSLAVVSRQRTSILRPMVSTAGLTRSNGRVSQAGKSRQSSRPRNWTRSSCNRAASVPVGHATMSGARSERCESAAMLIGLATSVIASRADVEPRAVVSAGSSRRSGGSPSKAGECEAVTDGSQTASRCRPRRRRRAQRHRRRARCRCPVQVCFVAAL
jgi:hypothetical protein